MTLGARKSFDEPWSRGLRMLALAAGLLLAAAACGEPREGGGPVGSAAPDTESGFCIRTPTPGAVIYDHEPPYAGAASPTVEERIYDSDVVVRASLHSAEPGKLRFRAIEYLKGTGPADFVVNADTAGRDTKWDKLRGGALPDQGVKHTGRGRRRVGVRLHRCPLQGTAGIHDRHAGPRLAACTGDPGRSIGRIRRRRGLRNRFGRGDGRLDGDHLPGRPALEDSLGVGGR